MSRCEGLHCPGCRDGSGKAVLVGGAILAGVVVAEWLAAHAVEVIAVTVVCGALAVAAVVALFRWAGRREARHAAERPFLTVREVSDDAVGKLPCGGQFPTAGLDTAERPALPFRDLHIHLDGAPSAEQAAVIRQALERN